MAVNKQISALVLTGLATVLAAALILAATFGGGAKRTVASRSAAAFLEAERKGEPVGGGGHGHGPVAPGAKAQPEQAGHRESEMTKPEDAERTGSRMAGHDMSGHGTTAPSPSADAHAGHATSPRGGTGSPRGRERQPQAPAGGHAGMQHGGAAAAGIPRDPTARDPMVPPPAPKAAEASPGQPAGTLQPDPLDQPAETSVLDAKRSAEMSQEMGGGHGMQHGTTSYRQLDAGRDSATTGQVEGSPKLPPGKPKPTALPPEPTHPPHHSDGEAMQ